MTNAYGKQSVLSVLPLCVKGDALEWYTGLNCGTTDRMDDDLAVWKDQLRRRFATDTMDALDKAHRLQFRWDREEQMDLCQYVTRKIMLLEEAGILDEDQQVRLLWRGLDANLMATVSPLVGGGNTLEGFTEELYQHEYPAKRLWKENHRPVPTSARSRPAEPPARYRPVVRNELDGPRFQSHEKVGGGAKSTIPAERRVTFPRVRERDCRHCGGPHMDYLCPTRNADRTARPVKAYLLEPDVPEEDRMIEVDYFPLRFTPDPEPESPESEAVPNEEEAGNNQRNHARVGMA